MRAFMEIERICSNVELKEVTGWSYTGTGMIEEA